jgi:hypothetical protein
MGPARTVDPVALVTGSPVEQRPSLVFRLRCPLLATALRRRFSTGAPRALQRRVSMAAQPVALCRPVEIHRGRTADAGGLSPFSCAERGAPGVECHHYWELEDLRALTPPAQPTVRSNTWGFCADPALFPNVASCASLDAGAHLDAGCAPR